MSEAVAPSRAAAPRGAAALPLTLAALGIVYGDIGTSPLYALREAFSGRYGIEASRAHVLGVLSLVFWALAAVVTVKYLGFIMRADNRGEGGIFALLALVPRVAERGPSGRARALVLLALFGAALLYGDGAITPAISVLSAVEGLQVGMDASQPAVIALTVAILVGLFLVQRRGTAGIGRVFGPIMLVWFTAIGLLGLVQVAREPSVLAALNPLYGVELFVERPFRTFALLGAVVLVVTGSEALYADMGHFGRRPIRLGWLGLVWPALVLNYFGQGALLLESPGAAVSPFYALVPRPLLYPMVGLATAATIIASQALISGAFSLARQAVQLGYWPRVTIVHTSESAEGQIYIPEVNYGLMVACIWLVLEFQESGALAAAYGLAVTGTMTITSIVYFVVLTQAWRWPPWRAGLLVAGFLAFDLPFLGSALLKFTEGGWFPVAVGAAVFAVMLTWKDGRAVLARQMQERTMPMDLLLEDVARRRLPRVPGTAVFMASDPRGAPVALLHHLKHDKVLHEQVVLLSIVPKDVPRVPADERLAIERLGEGFWRVVARYGFMETPNVPEILGRCLGHGLSTDPMTTTFYLSRETLLTHGRSGMMRWRKALFAFLSRNARPATAYFGIPPGRVVELGMQVEI
ncbi:MAG TPA: potassium transporter Kup [Thermodesulfobacteriota bacterium]